MKRVFLALFVCICITLSGCSGAGLNGEDPQGTQDVTQGSEGTKIKDYPDGIDTTEGKLLTPLLPDEVFTSTAQENGNGGTLYQIYGTVEEFGYDENGAIEWFRVSTHKGDIVVGDPCPAIINSGTVDAEKLREFFPLPAAGEFVRIFAEYQGMSGKFNCPYFIYTSEDYMVNATIASMKDFEDIVGPTQGDTAEPTTEFTTPEETVPQVTEPPVTEPPVTEPPVTEPPVTEPQPTNPTPTVGERNALQSAKNYLRVMAFSYEGLIDQLEYEGYTNAEATYAANNCGADWNEQALKSAKTYLSVSAFSYSGLIKQLEYEEYTTSQATYGADHCGADWNEQALKSAKTYLSVSAFSYSGLIEQLEYEEYTASQAAYGADNCGADWNEQAAKAAATYLSVMSFSRDQLISQLEYEGFTHDQAVYGANAAGLK